MELKAPQFWHFMLATLFKVGSQRLREQVWQRYPKSAALRWQLALCAEPAGSPCVVYERVKALCQLLSPATLLRVAEGLAPVGKPRPRELRQFEETVLRLTDKHGQFIWLLEEQTDGHQRTTSHRRA
jgi:hypothetical protein